MNTVSLLLCLDNFVLATDKREILLAVTQNKTAANRNIATSHFVTDNQTDGLGSIGFSWWTLAVFLTVYSISKLSQAPWVAILACKSKRCNVVVLLNTSVEIMLCLNGQGTINMTSVTRR